VRAVRRDAGAAFRHPGVAIAAAVALALVVAAVVERPVPDFAGRPVAAVLRDRAGRATWAIRLAPAAHEIAADALRAEPAPAGRAYQLWLLPNGAAAPRSLGLLPGAGRRVIPLSPLAARLLAGAGRLIVTLEPAEGAGDARPASPALYRAALAPRRAPVN
jgi:anti-sigma-K factor RskA